MKCPKCKNKKELWKAKYVRSHNVVILGLMCVQLTCPCGYNFNPYVMNKDLVTVAVELRKIKEEIKRIGANMTGLESSEVKRKRDIFRVFRKR